MNLSAIAKLLTNVLAPGCIFVSPPTDSQNDDLKCHSNTVIVKADLSQEILLHFVYSLKGIMAKITLWQPFSWTQLLGVWQEVFPIPLPNLLMEWQILSVFPLHFTYSIALFVVVQFEMETTIKLFFFILSIAVFSQYLQCFAAFIHFLQCSGNPKKLTPTKHLFFQFLDQGRTQVNTIVTKSLLKYFLLK